MIDKPPFEIVSQDGIRVASNGALRVTLLDDGGRLFKRRGVTGLTRKPAAEVVLPQLNEFAGELIKQLDMPSQDVANRLRAIAGTISHEPPKRVEWAVIELDGVYVYSDGENVVVTKQDLMP